MTENEAKVMVEQELRSIFRAALVSNWDRISVALLTYMQATGVFPPNLWSIKALLSEQYEESLRAAIKAQENLFAEVAAQIARKEAEKKLRQKLQAKGMSTELLDSIAKGA